MFTDVLQKQTAGNGGDTSAEQTAEQTVQTEETFIPDENAEPYLGVWTSAMGQILAFYDDGTCFLNGDSNHTYRMNGKKCEIDEINTAEIKDEAGDCLVVDFSELGFSRTYYRGTQKSVDEQRKANSDISWMLGEWNVTQNGAYKFKQIVIREDGTCDLIHSSDEYAVYGASWKKGVINQESFSGITIYVDEEPIYCFTGIPMLEKGYFGDELPADDFSFREYVR